MQLKRDEQQLILNGKAVSLSSFHTVIETAAQELKPYLEELHHFLITWFDTTDTIELKTSGSTGTPKTIVVQKQQMIESARITCEYLQLKPGDGALLCLPLQYIAGKMMIIRALVAKLDLYIVPPSNNPLDTIQHSFKFAAMVPSQVYQTIQDTETRNKLIQIDTLIIGGSAINDKLEEQLIKLPNHIYATYGMTETLSHIALREIDIKNTHKSYLPLPGVNLSLSEESTLIIDAPHVCNDILYTNDVVQFLNDGSFIILGRKDNIINSGGVKIQIEEVEKALSKSIHTPFAITSIPHPKWGEQVVLLIEQSIKKSSSYKEAITLLPKLWQPQQIYYIDTLPLTPTGKIDRGSCKRIASLHSNL